MNRSKVVARNTIILLISNIFSKFLAFGYIYYVARYLDADGYGILSFAIAFTGIFSVLADMGLNSITIREVAKRNELAAKYIGNLLILKFFLGIVALLAIVLCANLFKYPFETIKVVYILGVSVFIGSMVSLFGSMFQAFEKMEYTSYGTIINGILMFIGSLLVVKSDLGIYWLASIYVLINIVNLIFFAVIYLTRFGTFSLEIDWAFWKQTIGVAWPMGAMAICIMIYFRIDTIMLAMMKDDAAVGIYSAAYGLSEMTTIVASMFIASMFPMMSQYYARSGKSLINIYERSFKYLLLLSLPMALSITLLANPIIYFVFGDGFSESVFTLQVIIWAAAIMYLTMLQGSMIVAVNKQIVSFKVAIIATILNISLNLIFIPRYSYIGASAATVATEAFGLLVGIILLSRWGYKLELKKLFGPPTLGLSIAGIISIILFNLGVNVLIISIIAVGAYSVIAYKLAINEEDMDLIKNLIDFPAIKTFIRGMI